VHRALQSGASEVTSALGTAAAAAAGSGSAARAAEALGAIRAHPVFAEALHAPDVVWRRHEVPFSWRRADGVVVRGTFDCIVRRADGRVQLFEFKTGQTHPVHTEQLAVYLDAARALFPGAIVEAWVISPRGGEQLSGAGSV
jgi:hypothetical protein